jgi:hypothetical protein
LAELAESFFRQAFLGMAPTPCIHQQPRNNSSSNSAFGR